VKKRPTHLIVQNLEEEVVHEVLIPEKGKRSLKELLLAMPEGEDADFERSPDHGRDVEL
jgi:hypothetical protein